MLGVGVNAVLVGGGGGLISVPEMDNPSVPWQCGGAWEGLLMLPVTL